jgi:hypothetical protein
MRTAGAITTAVAERVIKDMAELKGKLWNLSHKETQARSEVRQCHCQGAKPPRRRHVFTLSEKLLRDRQIRMLGIRAKLEVGEEAILRAKKEFDADRLDGVVMGVTQIGTGRLWRGARRIDGEVGLSVLRAVSLFRAMNSVRANEKNINPSRIRNLGGVFRLQVRAGGLIASSQSRGFSRFHTPRNGVREARLVRAERKSPESE